MQELLGACSPATFGSNGKDILDEEYRKAIKLDWSNFAVDFYPHDYGIVDAIAQTLLPRINPLRAGAFGTNGNDNSEHWGVRCELYKLNVSYDFGNVEHTLMKNRCMRGQVENSRNMLIHLEELPNLAVWLFVCHACIKVFSRCCDAPQEVMLISHQEVNFSSRTKAMMLCSTGATRPARSNGVLSTAIASMKY